MAFSKYTLISTITLFCTLNTVCSKAQADDLYVTSCTGDSISSDWEDDCAVNPIGEQCIAIRETGIIDICTISDGSTCMITYDIDCVGVYFRGNPIPWTCQNGGLFNGCYRYLH
jgi:hypothetical protein